MQALLPQATTGPDFARLLWLIEELLYEDLLKGSGWGRRRGWFREQLEAVRNVAQVSTIFSCVLQARGGSADGTP